MPTIAILTKQSHIKKDCFFRLFCNLSRLRKLDKNADIIVADSSRGIGRFLIRLISRIHRADYQYIPPNYRYYSPSHIKNRVAKYVFDQGKEYIFFLDIDVLMNLSTLNYVRRLIKNQIGFYWVPIKFTNRTVSNREMLKYICTSQETKVEDKHILQTGFVTGIQLIQRDLFLSLNGYNETLQGYGGEDIEFIHRATLALKMRNPFSPDSCYFIDDKGYDLSSLIGFRNFYRTLYYKHFEDIHLHHFWHKRKNKSAYLRNRGVNDQIMLSLMKESG